MGSSTSAGSSLFVGDSKTTQLFPPTGAKTHAAGSVAPATGAAAPNPPKPHASGAPAVDAAASSAVESHGVDALTAETPVAPDGTRAGDAPESPAASVNQAPQAAGVHNVSDPSEASDDDLLDYVPTPTPFMMFEDATGATTSLRQIGAMGPAIFLYVSPSCGSCLHVMDAAPAWQEQLGALRVGDDLRLVRAAVDDLAVLDGLDERGNLGLPLRAAGVGVGAREAALGNCHGYRPRGLGGVPGRGRPASHLARRARLP